MQCILKSVHNRRVSSKSNVNCCVYGCSAVNKKNPELSFHKFPPAGQKVIYVDVFGEKSVSDRRKLWEVNLKMGKAVTPSMHVCSRHFTDEDYITPNEDCYVKRILKKKSVPTQNLPERKTHTHTVSSKSQTKSKEERLKRLNNRRRITEESQQVSYPEDNNNFKENDAVEALLSLHVGSLEKPCSENLNMLTKTFADSYTQTEESCFFKETKTFDEVGVQVNTSGFSIAEFLTDDVSLNIMSGITTFTFLTFLVNVFSKLKKDIRTHRLPIKNRILLVFIKLKLDLTYSALGVLFGNISVPTVKRIFIDTMQVLADIMKNFIFFPSKETVLLNMPKCFKRYQKVRIILDCTEITVQTPKKLCCRIKLYSHYKKHHTLKFMTGVTPSGFICYISPCYGGRASDKSIFEQSNVLEQLQPYHDEVMVDKGFLIDKICEEYGVKIVRPPFLRKKQQFNRTEALENRTIASARVHIERVNARIKIFRILKNNFPMHLIGSADNIFILICAIVNLSKPVMRDELFL